MRAVKTVISAAGNLKRENPEMSEVKFDLAQLEFLNFFFNYLLFQSVNAE